MLIKLFGYLVALILLLVLALVTVVRFQPQWLVSAVNAVQSDVLVSADAMSVHFDPLELQIGALDLDLPADQKMKLANVSTQANFSAWWTDEPFWLVEVDRADVQLGAAEESAVKEAVDEEPTDAKSTPLEFLSYLTFTKVRIGELLVEQEGVAAPLLRLQLNAGQQFASQQAQDIALTATGEAAGTAFELAGTLTRNAQTLGFDLQGGASSIESDEMQTTLALIGELAGGKTPSILLNSGNVEVLLGADKHLVQQLAGRITVMEVGDNDGVELQQFAGQYQAPGWEAPLDFALNLVGGTPAGAWQVDGTAEVGQSLITLETLSTNAVDSWHGQLNLSSKGLPPAFAVQPYVDADLFPLTLVSEVAASAADLELSGLTFESPTNQFAGTLKLAFDGPIKVSADLQAQRLYLPLVASSDAPEGSDAEEVDVPADVEKTKTDPTPVFAEEPLDWSWLQVAQVDVALTAQELKLQDAVFTDFDVKLNSADGQLELKPFAATIGNGGFSGAVELGLTNKDTDADAVAAVVSLQVNDVELESFGFVPQEELKGGALEVDLQLKTVGRSAHDLAAALQGDILVIVDEARLMNDFIELAGSDLLMETLNKLNPFSKNDPTTELECGLVHFSAEQGVLSTNKQLVMETSKMEIVGDGKVDLNKEKLSITFSPIAKSGVGLNVGSLVKFLKLGGRLNDPKPAADAGGLLKSGVAIGAAISTGGLSVVADGVASRALNAGSACAAIRKTRAAAATPAATPAQG